MKTFEGKVLFLDRNDINTDEIIPAKYLTESTKIALKPYTLEDLNIDGFNPKKDIEGKSVIITRENFGCGSSREHAPWALEVNGINAVLAVNYARIFRQNMFNCGMVAIELSKETIEKLFNDYKGKDTFVSIDINSQKITVEANGKKETISFNVDGFDKALVLAGGWVDFADKKY
ncbi:MAG: 3-isopropylmalate dehydratase [Spirochaetes bacterium GWD1_27_9]|nr:MAG: 3-isopropylmalate dehydratase [Spirochaetes bacterium GWB1_27_13]OHD26587.1 MAG: 3-isopropylmalate dehydratase [Spirochaetes bacterium GWC1_27_15]OHD45605.1 MAG: 3-isopropylmalate dehydratase [Spirochaetes bacterium GWD1_27_9]